MNGHPHATAAANTPAARKELLAISIRQNGEPPGRDDLTRSRDQGDPQMNHRSLRRTSTHDCRGKPIRSSDLEFINGARPDAAAAAPHSFPCAAFTAPDEEAVK